QVAAPRCDGRLGADGVAEGVGMRTLVAPEPGDICPALPLVGGDRVGGELAPAEIPGDRGQRFIRGWPASGPELAHPCCHDAHQSLRGRVAGTWRALPPPAPSTCSLRR